MTLTGIPFGQLRKQTRAKAPAQTGIRPRRMCAGAAVRGAGQIAILVFQQQSLQVLVA
jgi:hypothetical protein